ncbi:MAG TPA: dihydrolipoamide acetyltransferase family protein, partial [Candidatus Nanopelagicales bacterium]|nr:dihydrolipoamide acetyltransferase family protein [Candidatus Nanopelagicales bacterium]
MSEVKTFLLPDVGEGLTEAEILSWHVKPGDTVTVNQIIVEIETAKAAVELPCPFAGTIAELFAAEGEVVEVGRPILSIAMEGAGGTQPPTAADDAPPAADAQAVADMVPTGEKAQREAVLVGYGVKQTGTPQRRARVLAHDPHGTTQPEAGPPGEAVKPVRHGGLEVGRQLEAVLSKRSPVLAKPPVRRLAKDLHVDLSGVDATGADGVITRADVERAARLSGTGAAQGLAAVHPLPVARDAQGRETRTPIKGVTKLMAEAMVASAFTAPHVTEWVEVDVTRSLELVETLKKRPELEGVRVSPLLLVALGLVHAVRRHPGINATWDAAAGEIVTKHYVNLGIAAATPRGLVVPNVKDADSLDLVGLARGLHDLVETAKAGRTQPSDMSGGTITITNVGVFGVDGGTPIINPGESAILAMGRAVAKPWVVDGEVRVRQVMQLTLS